MVDIDIYSAYAGGVDFSARAIQAVWVLGSALVLVLAIYIVTQLNQAGASGPDLTTSGSLTASGLPATVAVGDTSYLDIHIKDTGTADLPHALFDLSGLKDHWILNGISGSPTVAGDYYDYGLLPAGGTLHLSLSVTAKDAGNHDANIALWGDQDSNGFPIGDAPLDARTKSVAVDP